MKKTKTFIIVISALLFLLISSNCYADYFTEYVWYRVEPEMSRIVITTEMLRGSKPVDEFKKNQKEHEKDNKFYTYFPYDTDDRIYTREEVLDGHKIKTKIIIYSRHHRGVESAIPKIFVEIFFDDSLIIACPLGSSQSSWLYIPKITINSYEQSASVLAVGSKNNDTVWNFFDDRFENEAIVANDKGKITTKPEYFAFFGIGIRERDNGQYHQAFDYFQKTLEIAPDYSPASLEIAHMYMNGNGVDKNPKIGFQMMKYIADNERNDTYIKSLAESNVGIYYAEGLGCEYDIWMAKKYLRRAIKNGDKRVLDYLQYIARIEEPYSKMIKNLLLYKQ